MLGHTQHEFKTTKVKSKDYVEVKERVKYLAHEYPNPYSIETEYQYIDSRLMWIVKAKLTIYYEDKQLVFNGLAQEVESDKTNTVNNTSALENAETSAIGRACAAAGIGVDHAIASADEVHKALNRESNGQPAPKKEVPVEASEKVKTLRKELKTLLSDEFITEEERATSLSLIESYSQSKLEESIIKINQVIDKRMAKYANSK